MKPRPIDTEEHETMAQTVARHLRQAILDNEIEPGSPIRQEALAKSLGVSRFPVREALRLLESEGLVVIQPNSGARVPVLDFDDHLELYNIRERVEPLAMRESLARWRQEWNSDVLSLLDEISRQTDESAFLDLDHRLHLALYRGLSGNSRLLKMVRELRVATQRYRRVLLKTITERDLELLAMQHALIVDAVVLGNSSAAEDLIRAHISSSRERLDLYRERFDR